MLYSVESSPVVAMVGSLPAWRTMEKGVDDGVDVAQLEASLTYLGYNADGEMTVDAHFDSDTVAVVERWQEGLGLDLTGSVPLGSVAFIPAAATVLGVTAAVGDKLADGDVVLSLSGSTQQVVIGVPAELRAGVVPGLAVRMDGGTGTVTRLRSAEQDGTVTVEAVVTPNAPLAAPVGSVVSAELSLTTAGGALLVPVEALLSRIDGTYAVQLPDADQRHRFLRVEVVGVSGRDVAVTGEGLRAGDVVMTPA
jgi:hypothetical protein